MTEKEIKKVIFNIIADALYKYYNDRHSNYSYTQIVTLTENYTKDISNNIIYQIDEILDHPEEEEED